MENIQGMITDFYQQHPLSPTQIMELIGITLFAVALLFKTTCPAVIFSILIAHYTVVLSGKTGQSAQSASLYLTFILMLVITLVFYKPNDLTTTITKIKTLLKKNERSKKDMDKMLSDYKGKEKELLVTLIDEFDTKISDFPPPPTKVTSSERKMKEEKLRKDEAFRVKELKELKANQMKMMQQSKTELSTKTISR
jgi:hypothetical protein